VPTFLETVIANTRHELERRRRALPEDALRAQLSELSGERPFATALAAPGMSLIAEMKRASPSRGVIQADAQVAPIVSAYAAAGAAAISVLTEPKWFGGSLDDLAEARATVTTPLLRKDFLVDPYQLVEARMAGASAALLIVAAFDDAASLRAMIDAADAVGLDSLVEVHDEGDLATALAAEARIIGINNRDLHSLDVDLGTSLRLRPLIPVGITVVAESGITTRADVAELEQAGIDAILVGEALMRVNDPAATAAELLGRAETGGGGAAPAPGAPPMR
jgi:indole-3-glycerol phosphate synthase